MNRINRMFALVRNTQAISTRASTNIDIHVSKWKLTVAVCVICAIFFLSIHVLYCLALSTCFLCLCSLSCNWQMLEVIANDVDQATTHWAHFGLFSITTFCLLGY